MKIISPIQSWALEFITVLIHLHNHTWIFSSKYDPKLSSVFVRWWVVNITELPINKVTGQHKRLLGYGSSQQL